MLYVIKVVLQTIRRINEMGFGLNYFNYSLIVWQYNLRNNFIPQIRGFLTFIRIRGKGLWTECLKHIIIRTSKSIERIVKF